MATIAILGTLDTKGAEHAFVAEQIRALGHRTLMIDIGSGDAPSSIPDITRELVAEATGEDFTELLKCTDRGECVSAMSLTAPALPAKLAVEGQIDESTHRRS